jgi:beta-glucosidase
MNTKQKLKFPAGFLWGAATSAHQVEGNNRNDWTEWEKKNAERLAKVTPEKFADWQVKKFPEMLTPENYISGRACDHYNCYAEDFDIAKSLGHNAHRFSIEWSRIEPEEGKFDEQEIEHYRKVIKTIRERGMEPFVTLWHWTMPIWLEKKGGCHSQDFIEYFVRYAKYVTEELGNEIKFIVTLNEPTSVIANSYVAGIWPPQKKNIFSALKVYRILAEAHNAAYEELKKTKNDLKIGLANILQFLEPYNEKSVLDRLAAKVSNYYTNKKFYDMTSGRHDFLALQYYFHKRIKFLPGTKNEKKDVTDMGWEIYPEGIYHLIKNLQKYDLPIYITENGLADADDMKREKFIKEHLFWAHKAISEGADVRGYFHWSLLDNFEWDKGFWPRFGLVEIDYKTLERKIRPSAQEYAKICQNNEVEI